MAILRPDTSTTLNGVKINEYLLTKHNPNHIVIYQKRQNIFVMDSRRRLPSLFFFTN